MCVSFTRGDLGKELFHDRQMSATSKNVSEREHLIVPNDGGQSAIRLRFPSPRLHHHNSQVSLAKSVVLEVATQSDLQSEGHFSPNNTSM